MSVQWKKGDIFLVTLDAKRVGAGQIIDVLPSELYVVIFENSWNVGSPPSPQEVAGQTPQFASLTLDAKLHHGEWKIIGNITENLPAIKLPLSKVRISGKMHVETHDGRWRRPATIEEAEYLKFRKTVAPVRLEKALQAYHGLLEPHTAYDELRYDLIVDSAKIVDDR